MDRRRELRMLHDRIAAEQEAFAHEKRILEHKLATCQADNRGKEVMVEMLKAEVRSEQILRVAAQRGLVRYMREHGLGDRIGYDPDNDEALKPLLFELATSRPGTRG